MLKFDEQKQIDSVKGALALRGKIEEIVDQICKDGFKNICWLGIGGTYASCLQAEVHMKEKSGLDFFVENAAEYLTEGSCGQEAGHRADSARWSGHGGRRYEPDSCLPRRSHRPLPRSRDAESAGILLQTSRRRAGT